jgi:hypothetical protein
MSEPTATTNREPCATSGSSAWTEGHYTGGVLVCAACCAEIRKVQKSPAMPPTPEGRRQFDLWISGQPSRSPRP